MFKHSGRAKPFVLYPALSFLLMAATPAEKTRAFPVLDFSRVLIQGDFSISLETATRSAAIATGNVENLDGLIVQANRDLLIIKNRPLRFGDKRNKETKPIQIKLTSRSFRQISMNGNSTVSITKLKSPTLQVSIQGSGKLSLNGAELGRFELGMIGAGQAEMAGKSDVLIVRGDGEVGIIASNLATQDAQIYWNSTKSISANASRKASVTAFAKGTISVIGSAECEIQNRVGAEIQCGQNSPKK